MSDGMNETNPKPFTYGVSFDSEVGVIDSKTPYSESKAEESSLDRVSAKAMLEKIEKATTSALYQFLFEAFENPKHTKELKFKVTFSLDDSED